MAFKSVFNRSFTTHAWFQLSSRNFETLMNLHKDAYTLDFFSCLISLDRVSKERAHCCSHFVGGTFITAACGGLAGTDWITLSSAFKSYPITRISYCHPPKFQETWKLTKRFVIWEWWAFSETWGEPVHQETESHSPSLPFVAHPFPLLLQDWRTAVYCQYKKNYMHFI